MKITFFGGAKTVTGANYLLEVGKTRVLIDCGLFQGPAELVSLNEDPFSYDPKSISHVFITHSHQDHCGRLPKLCAEGFDGEIVCTPPSKEMMEASLQDSARLIEREAEESGFPAIYEMADVEKAVSQMRGYRYNHVIPISNELSVRLLNPAHILGSAMYQFVATEKGKKTVITFTGDIGNQPAPLLPPHDIIDYTDYLVMESAYGNRNHESNVEKKEQLKKVILDTVWHKAALVIPSFAIERTQELLYEINNMVEKKEIPRVPIFVDSPLATKMTEIYRKYSSYFNFKTMQIIKSGDDIFRFPGLVFTKTKDESKKINSTQGPKIIMAGSGMSTGGRIMYHEKLYLPNSKNFMLFVGYQVSGTLGRRIMDGEPVVQILGEKIKVKAHIRNIGGYSAHADQRQLINFVDQIKTKPKEVFIVQGEREAAFALKEKLETLLKIKANVPKFEEVIEV